MVGHPVPGFHDFLIKPKDEQSVQAIHNGEANPEPLALPLADCIQFIRAPCVLPAWGRMGQLHGAVCAWSGGAV